MKPLHEGLCAPPNAPRGMRKPPGISLLAESTAPRRGDYEGLELFSEAARKLGEQRPAHKQRNNSDNSTRA